MRLLVIALILFAGSFAAQAQFPVYIQASLHEKPNLFVNFTGYTSFIKGDWAMFSGLRTGLNYNNTIKFGLGVSHLTSAVISPIHIMADELNYSTNASLHFTYGEASVEYVFYKNEQWEFSIPVAVGCGGAHYNYISRSKNGLTHSPNYTAWIAEPEVSAQFTIPKWIGANASLGYLGTLHASPALKGNFNSITFSAGFSLFLDEIWKSVM